MIGCTCLPLHVATILVCLPNPSAAGSRQLPGLLCFVRVKYIGGEWTKHGRHTESRLSNGESRGELPSLPLGLQFVKSSASGWSDEKHFLLTSCVACGEVEVSLSISRRFCQVRPHIRSHGLMYSCNFIRPPRTTRIQASRCGPTSGQQRM